VTATDRPVGAAAGEPVVDRSLARATATITAWNLVSRVTGLARVVAVTAAVGATYLGNVYQSANLVSNILFELLAGGLLSAVLVPTFVRHLEAGDRRGAARLAAAVLARGLAVLGAIVAVGVLAASQVMRLLTLGVDGGDLRDAQVRLGAFLLWFFLPQVLLYAVGAVATALLHADRRFVAAAVAPVANNVVVIATMVAFRAMRGSDTTLGLDLAEKLLLAAGTTAGVVAMTVVPLVAVRRAGLAARPNWSTEGERTRDLMGRGVWAAGHAGLNWALVGVTIVLANPVEGGVVAYQYAWTFFLLPFALLANPVFTALYPRLAADAAGGRHEAFAADVGGGVRWTAFLVVPAAALLAVAAAPALALVRLGALDAEGARLVAAVLAAYALGLPGYGLSFLLTRACYALDDVRWPTYVNLAVAAGATVLMVALQAAVDGDTRVVVLGIAHTVAATAGAVALHGRVRALLGRPVPVAGALARDAALAAAAALAAWAVVEAVGWGSRGSAAVALAGAAAVGGAAYLGGALLTGAPEVRHPRRALARGGAA
jgi:putative peptidoglycan lipid II flippase